MEKSVLKMHGWNKPNPMIRSHTSIVPYYFAPHVIVSAHDGQTEQA